MKKALTKLTKGEKKQAQELRIEIDWLYRIAKNKEPVFLLQGDMWWLAHYMVAIAKYAEIYKQQLEAGQDIWKW